MRAEPIDEKVIYADASPRVLDNARRVRRLLLAAIDMEQVRSTSRHLSAGKDGDDYQLARGLEAAIAVCYGRPFTDNEMIGPLDPVKYAPELDELRPLHAELLRLRNQMYAHTGTEAHRYAGVTIEPGDDGAVMVQYSESWHALDRIALPAIQALAEIQRERFRTEALAIIEREHGVYQVVQRMFAQEPGQTTTTEALSPPLRRKA